MRGADGLHQATVCRTVGQINVLWHIFCFIDVCIVKVRPTNRIVVNMDRVCTKQNQVNRAIQDLGWCNSREDMLVSQVMTRQPSCVSPHVSALELIEIFHEKMFRHLLVTDADEKLIGVISDRDVVRCLGYDRKPDRETLGRIKTREIMSTDLVTVGPDTSLSHAISILLGQGISCLPVIEDGRLVGIVTNTDLHVVLKQLLQTIPRP